MGVVVPPGGTQFGDRLQLDRDDQDRVTRVRQGTVGGNPLAAPQGYVLEITYAQDGSLQADLATSEEVFEVSEQGETTGACRRLHFDADGRSTRTEFGCETLELAREYHYDASGRPLDVIGHRDIAESLDGVGERFGPVNPWRIDWDYGTPNQVIITWNELDHRADTPVEVNQRLVRHLDDSGRVVRADFDFGDDGGIDERFTYAYADRDARQWPEATFDHGVDGLLEVVVTRRQEGSITEVERRHMAQQGDERTYYITGGIHFLEDDAPAYAEPQSVAHWTLEHDGQDRLSAGSLLKRFASLAGTEDSLDATQTADYHASGYPERMRVASALTGDFGYRGSIEARCCLVSACEDRPIAADGIPTHLTCLSSSADDFGPAPLLTLPRNRFVPPPLDRLPALRRRARSFSELRLDPPTPRELVGY